MSENGIVETLDDNAPALAEEPCRVHSEVFELDRRLAHIALANENKARVDERARTKANNKPFQCLVLDGTAKAEENRRFACKGLVFVYYSTKATFGNNPGANASQNVLKCLNEPFEICLKSKRPWDCGNETP